jgi:hypothetical protein
MPTATGGDICMIETPVAKPVTTVVEPSTPAWLGESAAAEASIAAYLNAGDRMRVIMELTMIACAALLLLVIVAWGVGMLPGAVRLF